MSKLGYPTGYNYTNITTATSTQVSTKAGTVLASVIINKWVANGVVAIYDNASSAANPIATITAGATVLSDPPIQATFNVTCKNGLRIVTTGANDITVIWAGQA